MLKELYTAALGMVPQQTRLEVLANNMANASTTGYKKQNVFERNLIEATGNFFNVPGNVEQDDPPTGSYIDFSKGALQHTENPLDMAVENPNGFFVIQDEAGKLYYTKAGQFKLSTDGTIQAMDGNVLMGQQGPLNLRNELLSDSNNLLNTRAVNLKIAENGDVFANSNRVGSIQIVNIENLESLQKISNMSFIATKDTVAENLSQDEINIKQGWLENSNVDIVKEMISMIELQRLFETGSKVIQTNNETLDRSIALGRYY